MSVFDSMKISGSGLALERLKMDTISTNIANVNTTRTEEGGPYLKKQVLFEESVSRAKDSLTGKYGRKGMGVKVVGIKEDTESINIIYDPNHPDADEDGYIRVSNVNMVDEMISLMNTLRSYEANVTALNASKNILKKALDIFKG